MGLAEIIRGSVFIGIPDTVHNSENQQVKMKSADSIFLYARLSNDKKSGFVSNCSTGSKYYVTMSGCECKEFKQSHKPCKHMYKLAFVSGRMDPYKFYRADDYHFKHVNINPESLRFKDTSGNNMSLNKYEVTAFIAKTKREKKFTMYGKNEEDIKARIPKAYDSPPRRVKQVAFDMPSDRQLVHAKYMGIKLPENCCKVDANALIEAAMDKSFTPAPEILKAFAIKKRILFSGFTGEWELVQTIYNDLIGAERYAFMIVCFRAKKGPYDFKEWGKLVAKGMMLSEDLQFVKSADALKEFCGFKLKGKFPPPKEGTYLYRKIAELS